jgi:hypothetical protein
VIFTENTAQVNKLGRIHPSFQGVITGQIKGGVIGDDNLVVRPIEKKSIPVGLPVDITGE